MHQFLVHDKTTIADLIHDPSTRLSLARMVDGAELVALIREVDLTDPVIVADALELCEQFVTENETRVSWSRDMGGQKTLLDADGHHLLTVTV